MSISQSILEKIVSEQEIVALGLVTPDGRPHTTPVWIGSKDGKLYICTRYNRAKAKYALLNPECMIAFDWASIRGRVNVLQKGSIEFQEHQDVLDSRYGKHTGYAEYKQNWDAILEIIPYKLYR